MDKEALQKNLQNVVNTINENKLNGSEVHLVAVTKYVNSDVVRFLNELGINKFAENRPDELLKKQDELENINQDIEWHFVGRLQRRPVRKIINKIEYLHSLDRMSLVKEVNKRANQPIKCFLQVNISGEEQKAGFQPEEVIQLIKALKDYPNIQIVGLMTMAPYGASEERLREYFKQLKAKQEEVAALNLTYAPCTELSMGMSEDYPIALQAGATMVRIGRALYS